MWRTRETVEIAARAALTGGISISLGLRASADKLKLRFVFAAGL